MRQFLKKVLVLARRRANRGMEGLALTPDGKILVDLTEYLPNKYPHDKLEGLWITGRNSIAVANDNDFAVTVTDNKLVQKILPGTDKIDDDVVYVINLEEPLY